MNQAKQVVINASAHIIPFQAGFFHACVTSPPYWGLRKYAGEQMVDWPVVEYSPMPGLPTITIAAQAAALGVEDTLEAYVGHLVLVFREVRRVLRGDGACWLNLGDGYFRSRGGDLMMIPHRVALALQADGWTVRNDNVWAKANPMPESVAGWRWERCRVKVGSKRTSSQSSVVGIDDGRRDSPGGFQNSGGTLWADCSGCPKCEATGGYILRRGSWRHTRAHEFVFQLTKGMGYFADQERVREVFADERMGNPGAYQRLSAAERKVNNNRQDLGFLGAGGSWNEDGSKTGRNPRSVFDVTTKPYPGSHYAVFPPDLIAPLIRASVPTRCCPVCGAPWCPVVERTDQVDPSAKGSRFDQGKTGHNADGVQQGERYLTTVGGYRPTCSCIRDLAPVPGWLLDPFVGSGTSLAAAREQGVNAVGLNISAEYLDEQAKPRGCGLTPSRALNGLPLFAGIED